MSFTRVELGHGIGLRSRHYPDYLKGGVGTAWVEAISENFMGLGGRPLAVLERARADVPVALHGVSLSIGSTDPVDPRHLEDLRALVDRIQPAIVSDHLCWGSHRGRYIHDLLPLPYTEEAVAHVAARVSQVQEALGRQILLENVSSYLTYQADALTEWEFLSEIARRADCGILLDVNNIYVSARNHRFDPLAYLDGVPADRIGQFHLAGHSDRGAYLFDTHDGPVCAEVWKLYEEAVRRFGAVSTLIEWDEGVPPLGVLLKESRRAAEHEARVLHRGRRAS
ncbi:MAG TPA: DUF692 domain-containing protein [Myxococcales bacterium]|jgi:uncharacterized protein (UPF0276 family)|nr:DUF692 domain-containing protein [Myxococcales bacterium]